MAWAWSWVNLLSFFTTTTTCTSLLLLLIPLFSFLFLHLRRITRRSIVPVNWPVLGMLPTAPVHLHHLHDHGVRVLTATNWSFAFRGPWLLRMDMLFTCDPANVNHVFITRSAIYPKGPDFADIFELFGESLINTDGETWRAQRRMIHNLMTDRRFRSYELRASRDKVENGLIPLLRGLAESNAAVDLQDVFLRLTFDTTCALVLGVDPGCLSDGFPTIPFAKALDDACEAIFFRHAVPKIGWKVLKWLEIGRERKLAAAGRVMDDFVDATIAARRKQVEAANEGETIEPADLLTTYMLQSVGKRNSVEFVEFDGFLQANAKNLLLAGRNTTASTLTWFFWLLSKNPDVEKAILEELKANWPRPAASEESTPFDREALGKLVYLHAALCECLRLYPPVAIQHKGVSKADVLPSGHAVRPGTILIFHLYSMGRMEGIWGKDCMEFRPERWIVPAGDGCGGREIKHEPAHKFFAFNCGPRSCLGKEMSFNTMKTVVAAMLYNFHVEVVEGHVVEPKLAIILHMKYGLMVRIRKRDKSAW